MSSNKTHCEVLASFFFMTSTVNKCLKMLEKLLQATVCEKNLALLFDFQRKSISLEPHLPES